jgi:hypothetical protein
MKLRVGINTSPVKMLAVGFCWARGKEARICAKKSASRIADTDFDASRRRTCGSNAR